MTDLKTVLKDIKNRAQQYDITGEWPSADLNSLTAAGAMRWTISKKFGGDELSALDLHLKYEELAAVSVSTALILTQRDTAIGLVELSQSSLRAELIPKFLSNGKFTTVGFAQLTTSRQGAKPALSAEKFNGGYRLSGLIPWCTGAAKADYIVAGAVDPAAGQLLFLLQPTLPGISIDPPMPLVALRSTYTTSLNLKDVGVDDTCILRGPSDAVLSGRKNSLPLGQAYVAMGLCRGALNIIAEHRSDRAQSALGRFEESLKEVRTEIISLSQPGKEAEAQANNARLRGTVNDLALRITHAAVTLYKGSSLLSDHPAQRLAREALFLLVWSCPNPVIDCTVDLLSDV